MLREGGRCSNPTTPNNELCGTHVWSAELRRSRTPKCGCGCDAWTWEGPVPCIGCPQCGFTFATEHVAGEAKCPECGHGKKP